MTDCAFAFDFGEVKLSAELPRPHECREVTLRSEHVATCGKEPHPLYLVSLVSVDSLS